MEAIVNRQGVNVVKSWTGWSGNRGEHGIYIYYPRGTLSSPASKQGTGPHIHRSQCPSHATHTQLWHDNPLEDQMSLLMVKGKHKRIPPRYWFSQQETKKGAEEEKVGRGCFVGDITELRNGPSQTAQWILPVFCCICLRDCVNCWDVPWDFPVPPPTLPSPLPGMRLLEPSPHPPQSTTPQTPLIPTKPLFPLITPFHWDNSREWRVKTRGGRSPGTRAASWEEQGGALPACHRIGRATAICRDRLRGGHSKCDYTLELVITHYRMWLHVKAVRLMGCRQNWKMSGWGEWVGRTCMQAGEGQGVQAIRSWGQRLSCRNAYYTNLLTRHTKQHISVSLLWIKYPRCSPFTVIVVIQVFAWNQ